MGTLETSAINEVPCSFILCPYISLPTPDRRLLKTPKFGSVQYHFSLNHAH